MIIGLGRVDDENYEVVDKTLVNKNDVKTNVPKPINRTEPTAIRQPEPELEPELTENKKKFGKLK